MFPLLAFTALLVCVFLLPWRSWDWRRCVAITAIFIPLSLYLYAHLGWETGMRTKVALAQFEASESDADLANLHQALDQHLRIKSDDALALILEGRLLFAEKQYTKSREYFARAYQLMPGDPDLMIEYGTTLYLTEDKALNKLVAKIQALETKPLSAYSLLANIAMDQNDYAAAVQNWESMLARLEPGNPQASYIQALIISLKQLDTDARESQAEMAPGQS